MSALLVGVLLLFLLFVVASTLYVNILFIFINFFVNFNFLQKNKQFLKSQQFLYSFLLVSSRQTCDNDKSNISVFAFLLLLLPFDF